MLDWILGVSFGEKFELLKNREICGFCGLGAMVNVFSVACTSSFEVCWDSGREGDYYHEGVHSSCGVLKVGVVGSGM